MTTTDQSTGSSSGLSLAIRLQEGSSAAWRELVDLYGPLVESWCQRAGVPVTARADIGQEVFLAVHRGISGFDPAHPHATFRGWLWTITRNAILQSLRRRDPSPEGGTTAWDRLADIPDRWEIASSDEPPSTPGEMAALLKRALDQIRPTVEPHTWNAFWNTAVLGRSAPDVADELGISPAAVRQAKSRLLRHLRQQLGDR
jgi:RNA polymerase sigma-70 factor (ECF subfamily)